MADDKERLTTLAERLAEATAAREVNWELDEDVYSWGSAEGSVTVASRDRDDEPPYELVVYSPGREKVDELTSELLDEDRQAPWNDALAELHRAARRSALRADDIIDALIDSLSAPGSADASEGHSFLRRARAGVGGSDGDS